jgi:CxxC motif-containing protein (DUF1111 family)
VLGPSGRSSPLVLYSMRALVLANAVAVKADGTPASDVAVTIAGTIVDVDGRALEGVTVQLNGAPKITSVTRANGSYEIVGSASAAATVPWSVRPSRAGCRFAPSPTNLSSPVPRTNVNFTGSGPGCVGTMPVIARGSAATDPGPRPGPPGAGGPLLHDRDENARLAGAAAACIAGLAAPMLRLCKQAFLRFQEVDSVAGAIPGEEGGGLGPTFNGNSCAMCHAQPAVLGSSPGPLSPQRPIANPLVALATLDGADNSVPPFITEDGPIRIVRFKSDNDVHGLYTIAGRSDALRCTQAQPDFATNLANGNIGFRTPLALFGLGLVEAVSDATLQANLAASRSPDLGIAGMFNHSGDDGTISRFGRKAQDKSLLMFAAESYNIEIGVTNEMFPQERSAERGCTFNGIPEDITDPTMTGSVSDTSSDIENFAAAIRLSAPPTPALPPGVTRSSADSGRAEFESIGCANCHTPTLTTATSSLDPALSKIAIHPFSDFAIHHMGTGLADGIVQGLAGADQFRTTPLWGLGQRLFFLHDGRTTDLLETIEAHGTQGSEANVVITNFNTLSSGDQQDLLNFLRSL